MKVRCIACLLCFTALSWQVSILGNRKDSLTYVILQHVLGSCLALCVLVDFINIVTSTLICPLLEERAKEPGTIAVKKLQQIEHK